MHQAEMPHLLKDLFGVSEWRRQKAPPGLFFLSCQKHPGLLFYMPVDTARTLDMLARLRTAGTAGLVVYLFDAVFHRSATMSIMRDTTCDNSSDRFFWVLGQQLFILCLAIAGQVFFLTKLGLA